MTKIKSQIRKAMLVFALVAIPLEILSVCGCLDHCIIIEKLTHLITAFGSMSGLSAELIKITEEIKE